MILYTSSRESIQLQTTPLATPGGEGQVHRIINSLNYPNHCVKIFRPEMKSSKEIKIEHMIRNKPSKLSDTHYLFCWPSEIVFDNNGFIGYIMPLAFNKSENLYELIHLNLPQKSNFDSKKFDRNTRTGMENRLKVCFNILLSIHHIHNAGQSIHYTMVDYKPQNILVTDDGKISITDTDSFQISSAGNVIHHAEVVTPEYAPQEFIGSNLNPMRDYIHKTWDRFCFAVSFYQILFGIHPYAATSNGQYSNATTLGEKIEKGLFVHGSKRNFLTVIPPPHNHFNNLPSPIRTFFIRAFEIGHNDPSLRPTAYEWAGTIKTELDSRTGIKASGIIA